MTGFGDTIRQARLAKGLTLKQAAENTHILIQILEDLENEDFSRIPAPIYGRGFVKLCCEAFDIPDAPALIREFMEIYNGNRPPVIRMRGIPQPPPPAPPPAFDVTDGPAAPAPEAADAGEPSGAGEPSATVRPPDEPAIQPPDETSFRLESVSIRPTEPVASAPVSTPPPPPVETADEPAAVRLPRKPSRYAAPRPLEDDPGFTWPKVSIPPYVWRVGALALAALLVLWLLVVGVRALYRLTMTAPEPEKAPVATSESAPRQADGPAAAPAEKRQPLPVRPLYID